jgi:thiamine biosynthesis lipoprotein
MIGMLLLVAAVAGCAHRTGPGTDVRDGQRTLERYEFARVLMGTRCRIVVFAGSEQEAADAGARAFDRIAALESVLSDYRADSEASVLVGLPVDQWHAVSPDLAEVLELSRRVFDASDGAFDPTVGPLTKLWRETRRTRQLPDGSQLEAARAVVGLGFVELDGWARVRLRKSGMALDFGGIGKGYAADEALAVLRDAGFPIALIDFGGDLVAGDPPPVSPGGWTVEVRDGVGEVRRFVLANRAVATSGDLEQFVEIGATGVGGGRGVRYAHIVDPRTGLGLTRRTASTVIAERGWLADALASAACVLGPEGSEGLADRFPGVVIECVVGEDDRPDRVNPR